MNHKWRDLAGQVFGRLTVLKWEGIVRKQGRWLCRCKCGTEKSIITSKLKSGTTQSCGCLRDEMIGNVNRAGIVGRRFGRLVAMKSDRTKSGQVGWVCQCDCGKTTTVITASLIGGNTKSCGCLSVDRSKESPTRFRPGHVSTHSQKTHGMSDTLEYRIWILMRERCYNSKHNSYDRYGGRGIIVCDRWLDSFVNFIDDMGRRPSKDHSVDRINNDGNYEPGNCRWATHKEQSNNRKGNRHYTWGEETKTLTEWANRFNLPVPRLFQRLRHGWPLPLALTTPVGEIPDELAETRDEVSVEDKAKANAHYAVFCALKKGKLTKPACCSVPGCTKTVIQAHHHAGYAKENYLNVVWLCVSHHRQAEKKGQITAT